MKRSKQLEDINNQILECFTLIKSKEFNKAISITNKIFTEEGIQIDLTQKFGIRIIRLLALMALKKYDQVIEEIRLSEQILNQMDNSDKENSLVKDGIGRLFSIKGGIESTQGDLEQAIICYQSSIDIYESLNNKKSLFYQFEAIGWIKRAQGKLDEALSYFHKMLSLAEEILDERFIAQAKYSIAFINFYKGDLDQATEYAVESVAVYEKLKHFRGLVAAYSVFGSIYRGKGDFDKSLEYYHKVLTIFNENLGIQQRVTHSYCYALRNIGWIYYYKNNIKKSIEYLREAVKVHQSLCEYYGTIFDYDLIMFHLLLILSAIEIDDNQQIEDSMKELSRFGLKWPWTDYFRKFGKALILKNKRRAKYRFQAQQIFEEIREKKFDYQIEFMIQTNLCDLLLEELKYSGEEEILVEVQGLLNRISDLANNQRSITTLITLYSLQAKLALIEGNAELSRKLLAKALKIAENKGLELLSKKLTALQNRLFNQLEEWKALFIQNSKLQDRIEILNLKEYVTEAINEVLEKKFKTEKKYKIIYKDLLKDYPKIQSEKCRIGIAQIMLSETGDVLNEFFKLKASGLLGLKENKVEKVRSIFKNMIEQANSEGINILIFPEMTIDLNYKNILEEILNLAASLESKSEHPIAESIVKYANERHCTLREVDNFKAIEGMGIEGDISGEKYIAGNHKLFEERGWCDEKVHATLDKIEDERHTAILIGNSKGIIGIISISDSLRDSGKDIIETLIKNDIKEILEDELFLKFLKYLDREEYNVEKKEQMRNLVINAMRRLNS